jgi:hypothetical protein
LKAPPLFERDELSVNATHIFVDAIFLLSLSARELCEASIHGSEMARQLFLKRCGSSCQVWAFDCTNISELLDYSCNEITATGRRVDGDPFTTIGMGRYSR